jgi:hypothetical protein
LIIREVSIAVSTYQLDVELEIRDRRERGPFLRFFSAETSPVGSFEKFLFEGMTAARWQFLYFENPRSPHRQVCIFVYGGAGPLYFTLTVPKTDIIEKYYRTL